MQGGATVPTGNNGRHTFNARPDRVDFRDLLYRAPLRALPPCWPAPEQVAEHLDQYCADGLILDQGQEGACTGFGLAGVINYMLWEQARRQGGDIPAKVSPRMLYEMARLYDEWDGEDYEGSSCRGAMKGWHKHGVCTENFWPYQPGGPRQPPANGWNVDAARRPLGAYYRVDAKSVVDMQAAIAEVHAIYASARVHEGWELGTSKELPVIPFSGRHETGGHAFAIVGYDETGFIVQNSWGPGWGLRGFAVLSYDDWLKNGYDAWAAVLGAPIRVRSPSAVSAVPLQALAAPGQRRRVTTEAVGDGPQTASWSSDLAYDHTLVLGNNGEPLRRLLAASSAADNLTRVAFTRPRAEMGQRQLKKLLIYAHGGLNTEEDSIKRIGVLAPYMVANDLYPLFITWRTGFGESLLGILEDAARKVGIDLNLLRAAGITDWAKERLAESWDRALEAVAENLLAKAVWTQMKQNALAAAMDGGGVARLVGQLAALKKELPELEIHLIGHSAGAILLGHLLDRLHPAGLTAQSMTLLAPACTMRFAREHFGNAVDRGVLQRENVAFEILSDERERDDSIGPYRKSLLYLVSRALEAVHKMPLLGLDTAWDLKQSKAKDQFHQDRLVDIQAWLGFWADGPRPIVHKHQQMNNGEEAFTTCHGGFDNDIAVVERSLARACGGPLQVKVEKLDDF
jgi:hypothetical protein